MSDANGSVIATTAQPVQTLRVIKVVNAEMLKAHWLFLREKLLIIKNNAARPELRDRIAARKSGAPLVSTRGRARWIPEQIRFAVLRGLVGQSSCEMFWSVGPDETGQDVIKGFIVTTCDPDPFMQVPLDFFIWLAWAGEPGVVAASDAQVDALARERGCTGIEHMSPRMGWHRRLAKTGMALKHVVYRKELFGEGA
jgi:hypothetical protein